MVTTGPVGIWKVAGAIRRRRGSALLNRGFAEGAEYVNNRKTQGWRKTCGHRAEVVPCVVLDPFGGSGTVGVVAQRLGGREALVDLSGSYLEMAKDRIGVTTLPLGFSGLEEGSPSPQSSPVKGEEA